MKLATTYTDCQAVALERIYDKGTVLLSSYRRRKVRNHNGFGLFLYEFSQLNFIDIFLSKRLLGRT